MRQFTIGNIIFYTAILCVCIACWNANKRANSLSRQLELAKKDLLADCKWAGKLPLTNVAGKEVKELPNIELLGAKSSLSSKELWTMLKLRSREEGTMVDMVPDLIELLDENVEHFDAYTFDLNHPDNRGGRDLLHYYVLDGIIVLALREVDHSEW